MNFYLQQGHGMMGINREFVQNNPGSGVILSPRNCTKEQIERHAVELHRANALVLFDPQFYEPRTERENIINYPYWGNLDFDTVNFPANGATELCEGIIRYQTNVLGVSSIILPGRYTNVVTEEWLELQYSIAQTASAVQEEVPLYSTLALGSDVVSERTLLDRVLNETVEYPVDGVYIVLKHKNGDFLVSDDIYLYNLLDGLLSLSRSGKKIILGYANQQDLIYAGVGVTSIASGNFRNVRSFDPNLFGVQENDATMQRAVWYYDANTLSEYRSGALGLAYQRGMRDMFGPSCQYCRSLLEAENPAIVPWGEPLAFRHYLNELNHQWINLGEVPMNQRCNFIIEMLEVANNRLTSLINRGFRPGERSFIKIFEPTLNALYSLRNDRQSDLDDLGILD